MQQRCHRHCTRLARFPLKEDIAPATGNAFDQSHNAGSVLRFNAAQQVDERIHEVLARALSAAVGDVRRDAMQD
ncbi:hypothetical protein IB227_14465 [Stenotrophomonas sp. STM01]|nr:hypothetical protein [Stenotrophomonas sp. STM01]